MPRVRHKGEGGQVGGYRSWVLGHPWRAGLTVIISMIIGGALSVAIAAILETGNIVTGVALGIVTGVAVGAGCALGASGVLAGLALGLLPVQRKDTGHPRPAPPAPDTSPAGRMPPA